MSTAAKSNEDPTGATWPAMSMDAVEALLCAEDAPFAMETVTIRGIPTRVWKNALPNLAELARTGRTHGDKTFLVYEDERVTFDGWFRAVATLAHHLRGLGIGKGDRVALAMRNLPEWPVAFFAITAIGAICVPLNAWWTGAELAYGLSDPGVKLLICDAERLHRIALHRGDLPALEHVIVSRWAGDLPPDTARLEDAIGSPNDYAALTERELPETVLEPDDETSIFYTSGTTGNPKGAVVSHRNLVTNILSSGYNAARTFLRRGEAPPEPKPKVLLVVIPLFHCTACSAMMMGAVAAGNTMVFMHRWDAGQALGIIQREKVNITGGVPTIAWQLIEHPDRANYDLSSLESIGYGGAPSAPELVKKIREEFGALPGNGWGMTETTATVTGIAAEDYLAKPESCGPAVPVADLKIMDPDAAHELPSGEVGELWARGPMVVRGYWNKPEASAATFIDGWVRTGDLARLDDDRFCYIVDRAKDMLIRGGENIYSSEVENALYDHPAVTDAAVIGIPHRTLGEEPAAVVHLAPGADASEAELQDWVRTKIAAFKVPVRIVFLPETLPRNANGKILKKERRPLFEEPA